MLTVKGNPFDDLTIFPYPNNAIFMRFLNLIKLPAAYLSVKVIFIPGIYAFAKLAA